MTTVTSVNAQQALKLQQADALFIDVREPAEFNRCHIHAAKLHPLGSIDAKLLDQYDGQTIVIYCQKGIRGEKACKKILQNKPTANVVNLSGGIEAWEQAGFDTLAGNSDGVSLDQQVHIILTTAALTFSLLAALVTPHFLWGAAAIGVSLLIAGFSGFARLIALAPWNR